MSESRVPVDDQAVLARILASADALLLDFDGPVCSVFAGFPAAVVAGQLRRVLAEGGYNELAPEVEKSDDPFDVLNYAALMGADEMRFVEAALRAHEVEAIATAKPTLGAHRLIRLWHSTGRKLAIVSNNSTAAVEAYLHLHSLTACIDFVSARTNPNPALLKPKPFLLCRAHDVLGIKNDRSVLVGDSVTDIQAAHAAGSSVIGYANKPGKTELFIPLKPDVITTAIENIIQSHQV